MYQKVNMENGKNLELQLNLNLFKIYDTVSCMLNMHVYCPAQTWAIWA